MTKRNQVGTGTDTLVFSSPETTTARPAVLAEAASRFSRVPTGPLTKHQSVADLRKDHASGKLSDRQLVNRIAQVTGLQQAHFDLTPPDPALNNLLDPAFCLRHECLPWQRTDDCLWIATSRPETFGAASDQITKLIEPANTCIRPVLVGREACQTYIAETHKSELSDRSRSRTPLIMSCRAWRPKSRVRVGASLSAVAALGGLAIAFPDQVISAFVILAFLTMIVAATLKTAAVISKMTEQPAPGKARSISPLPTMSILVPLFRERRIAETLLRRLQKLDYPKDKLEILLVLEEDDIMTRSLLDRTQMPPGFRIIVVPDGTPRTKPRAMNYALDFCTGDIVGIYDAEDAPAPDQLFRVAEGFAQAPADVVCLQGVLDYYNARTNWISRCFTVEYNTWFRLLLPGMARLGFALPLGGTTLFIRRDKLEELGGWDAHNVTEDADLGFRLARAGYRTQVIDTTTGEEANTRIVPWIKQRSRWLKGYMATYLVHMRSPVTLWRDLGPWQFLGFQAHFVTALAHFTLAPLILCFWAVMFGIDLPFTTLDSDPRIRLLTFCFLIHELLTMALGVIATRRGGHRGMWFWVPLLHLYWPLGTIAMWKALYELVFKPFYWDKTDHGHSLDETTDQLTVPIPPESSFNRVTNAREI